MSWFQENLRMYDVDNAPLSPEERNNKFIGLVEDDDFEMVIIDLDMKETSDGGTSDSTNVSSG